MMTPLLNPIERWLVSRPTVKMLSLVFLLAGAVKTISAPPPTEHPPLRPLFNGRDLSGWDTWLGPQSSGYLDPKQTKEPPLGLNQDPLEVFTVVTVDGAPAIRISGQVFGAITSQESFGNVHIRVEYKWGEKKWPPRHEPRHYRDSGILYWCIGDHGAGSYAWMRSVECNIMEKGVGQWWGVAGTYVDIEGRKVVLDKEPWVPYRGESPGEECIVYLPGSPQFTTGEGITSSLDLEIPGAWNVCEVYAWSHIGIHLSNGKPVLVLTNPRYKDGDREFSLNNGRLQIQSEGAELFVRQIQVRPIHEIPPALRSQVPKSAPDEQGFVPLFGETPEDGWAQSGPGHFTLEKGVATGHGGMGLWWHSKRPYTNFVLRGEWRQDGTNSNSGVFVRFPAPGADPWVAVRQGHEFEIGDPKAAQAKEGTGSFYPFQGPSALPLAPVGEWNRYELTCVGPNFSLRINDALINTWTDTEGRPQTGFIGLQNYPYPHPVQHRSLRIKELPTPARE